MITILLTISENHLLWIRTVVFVQTTLETVLTLHTYVCTYVLAFICTYILHTYIHTITSNI